MTLQRIEEFRIQKTERSAIQALLCQSFSGYPPDRIYFKQLPDFRYLIWKEQQLAAHLAVEHRVINNDGQVLHVFGIVDLCVAREFQKKQLASRLLAELESLGRENGIDFLVLLASDLSFYESFGFQLVNNLCQWVIIHNHQAMAVKCRRMPDTLMVKPLGDKGWQPGPVDFLGPLF